MRLLNDFLFLFIIEMTDVVHAKVRCPYLDQLYRKDPKIVDDIIDKYNTWCNIDLNGPDYIGPDDWCYARELKNNYPELSKAIWCEIYAFVTVEIGERPNAKFYDMISLAVKPFPDEIIIRKYNFRDKDYYYSMYLLSTANAAAAAWSDNTGKPVYI